MKAINQDKFAAVLVSGLAIASFGVFPEAQANPVFPPAHVSTAADFSKANVGTTATTSLSWYRADAPQPQFESVTKIAASTENLAWYRAAN